MEIQDSRYGASSRVIERHSSLRFIFGFFAWIHKASKVLRADVSGSRSKRRRELLPRNRDPTIAEKITICLPFISDEVSTAIQQCLRRSALNNIVSVVKIPPSNLKRQLLRNRMYDRFYITPNCVICTTGKPGDCMCSGVVYLITYISCGEEFIGETARPLCARIREHLDGKQRSRESTPLGNHRRYSTTEPFLRLDYKDGKRHEFRVDGPHLKIPEEQRPLDIRVTIKPKFGTYEGVTERQRIFISEEAPQFPPENMTVLAYSPVEIYIYFDPVPTKTFAGKLKGCEVYVCETKLLPPICVSKLVPQGQNEVFFTEFLPGKIYHATAECLTSGGAGPRSPWITFETMELRPAGKKPYETIANTTYPRPKDIGVRVNIDVLEDMMILISWEFAMKDGSVFEQSLIKDFQVMKYRKEGAHYREVAVITKDKNLRDIGVGVSSSEFHAREQFGIFRVYYSTSLSVRLTPDFQTSIDARFARILYII
ncbi:hypothetical protein Y032_0126g1343 [Ancylostoma ceylanicum]|uniref:Fibronectin type-III domain-containing protein n=1 Tax=Ancylostoma ceylanicum TaxID=53326 RepID=A0A016T8L9_9BILA|nr:hypothetical protein Y032_0126g1343 [Ancylostoma ceylanicum]